MGSIAPTVLYLFQDFLSSNDLGQDEFYTHPDSSRDFLAQFRDRSFLQHQSIEVCWYNNRLHTTILDTF
jgi:hypothetical protein